MNRKRFSPVIMRSEHIRYLLLLQVMFGLVKLWLGIRRPHRRAWHLVSGAGIVIAGVWSLTLNWQIINGQQYNCSQIFGPNPRPGFIAVLPGHWGVQYEITAAGVVAIITDESNLFVCRQEFPGQKFPGVI